MGVIDGHRGAACAEEVARFLPSVIGSGSSFQDAFAHMDRVVTADAFQERSGACCCVATVKGVLLEEAQPTLDVAWLGDCRAFVARRLSRYLRAHWLGDRPVLRNDCRAAHLLPLGSYPRAGDRVSS